MVAVSTLSYLLQKVRFLATVDINEMQPIPEVRKSANTRSWWDLVFEASGVSQQLTTVVAVSTLSYLLQQVSLPRNRGTQQDATNSRGQEEQAHRQLVGPRL